MQDALILEDDWQILVRMLPHNWKELAKTSKAIVRKFLALIKTTCTDLIKIKARK